MADSRPCKQELLHWIDHVSFALDEVKLFLDTHPCNAEALEYFEKYQAERNCALHEYAKYYGPLTIDTLHTPCDNWDWIQSPWPWQKGGC